MKTIDHPIFLESIAFIQSQLGWTGLDPLQQQVLERLIHSSGDFDLKSLISFSPGACQKGVFALQSGANIFTDTAMALAAVLPMAVRTSNAKVRTVLDWVPEKTVEGTTRTALGMKRAWQELSIDCTSPPPIVLIGSAPKALETLLDLVSQGSIAPSLIIGMPVGFIGVAESKRRLSLSGLPNIALGGTRGGAGLAAAAMNALLRASMS
ncbi:precorrin-8X methylmutase [Prochlorococcus sp. MIT 1307]|uniref:precorrin-8X methylmutase n=1 Tax=Prochlorococcus sp. MIT 1307 TaxID=3096219 RepID=UPI002A74BC7F|nr:precorrin-8X methylmutase [Prochlorococcus sp. MIT 1307]